MVKQYWAGVKNLQAQIFGLLGNLLFIVGMWWIKRFGLGFNWRWLLLISQGAVTLRYTTK